MNPRFFRNGIVMLALVIVALAVVFTVVNQTSSSPDTPYSSFLENVSRGQVAKVQQEGSTLTVTPKPDGATYTVIVPGLLAKIQDKLGRDGSFPFDVSIFPQPRATRGDHNNVGPRVGVAWDPSNNGAMNVQRHRPISMPLA